MKKEKTAIDPSTNVKPMATVKKKGSNAMKKHCFFLFARTENGLAKI